MRAPVTNLADPYQYATVTYQAERAQYAAKERYWEARYNFWVIGCCMIREQYPAMAWELDMNCRHDLVRSDTTLSWLGHLISIYHTVDGSASFPCLVSIRWQGRASSLLVASTNLEFMSDTLFHLRELMILTA